MDATALRWVLAIIGIVTIAGVYLYSKYQKQLRHRAAIKTLSQDEVESGVIEDEHLSRELSSIHSMLDDNLADHDIQQIKINPALDSADKVSSHDNNEANKNNKKTSHQLAQEITAIGTENLVAHVLKHADDQLITGAELLNAFKHLGLEINEQGYGEFEQNPIAQYRLAALSENGSFDNISDPQFNTVGVVCFFDLSQVELPLTCYELMLKKIDELVRLLHLKVYNQDLRLMTLQHVTDMREKLKVHES